MDKFFSSLVGKIFRRIGGSIAGMLFAFTITAVENAEKVTLSDDDFARLGTDPKTLKQALKNKKRQSAIDEIQSRIPILGERIPEKAVNFFIEMVLTAKEFEFLDDIQSALK